MRTRTKWQLGILAVLVVAIAVAIGLTAQQKSIDTAPESTAPSEPALAADSHLLSEGSTDATFVEFLDFECPSCRQMAPVVEDLRAKHGDQVTFAMRYFPLPGHKNSMTSALAAEAAAQQGKFTEMADKLFETQPEWGGKQDSQADFFRGLAKELGLDLAEYDAAVADPATTERIESDKQAGEELGVQGTPTFFLNDTLVELETLEELQEAVAEAAQGS
ncbi:DsbA family protein [Leucobacter sp. M11]|uniref:DsbA family protein n=1 Tax=Leucobacter sp. M11 TaxID=2993565 RepID=UPI002D7ECE6A|nr:thioredoxin domain-containing protein [Leucobacter sp. M11]MEB4615169.1 thioredoxin domain-containing protein [Leucobacter sp. M11]